MELGAGADGFELPATLRTPSATLMHISVIGAIAISKDLISPAACGSEAAWAAEDMSILAPRYLIQLANHFKGTQVLSPPAGIIFSDNSYYYP